MLWFSCVDVVIEAKVEVEGVVVENAEKSSLSSASMFSTMTYKCRQPHESRHLLENGNTGGCRKSVMRSRE